MKKLMLIAALVTFSAGVFAQQGVPAKAKQDNATTTAPAGNKVKETNVTATPEAKTDKKECGTEKKECGDKKGGHSCCSPKAKKQS